MVEFIVMVFVSTVSIILIFSVIGTGLFIIFVEGYDAGPAINAVADIMTTIIGALIGFIAGRGQGSIEGKDEVIAAHKEYNKELMESGPPKL